MPELSVTSCKQAVFTSPAEDCGVSPKAAYKPNGSCMAARDSACCCCCCCCSTDDTAAEAKNIQLCDMNNLPIPCPMSVRASIWRCRQVVDEAEGVEQAPACQRRVDRNS
jgi:hypothetical protein